MPGGGAPTTPTARSLMPLPPMGVAQALETSFSGGAVTTAINYSQSIAAREADSPELFAAEPVGPGAT